ncbi:MAG: sulfotransferase [Deltaproteobacteria bacterium]|nr:sulfotransferase [Deltaproteobacteria bacterium]
MTTERPRPFRRLVPANFRDPVGLARRILASRDRAAYFAVASTALAAVAAPLDALLAATLERRLLDGHVAPKKPVVIVTGAPRSGTTVLSQALIHHLPVTYFDNLTAVFPRAPIAAHRLFGRFLPKPARTLHSYYGRTSGFASENDGLHLWDRWLGADRYAVPERLDAETAAGLRRFVAAWEHAFGRALVNKNNALATGVPAIAEALPTSHFVYIRRDPVFTAQSILGAREAIQGTRAAPYGVNDPARHETPARPIEDICAQIVYHERRMEEARRIVGDGRFWVVDYESFCAEPHAIVERVGREILGGDVDAAALRRRLPPLGNTNRPKLADAEMDEITTTLARLRAAPAARGTTA